MARNEYSRALEKAVTDLESRLRNRDILNAEIAGLRETVRVLMSRIQLSKEEQQIISRLLDMVDYATPSLTASILGILSRDYPTEMTAIDVRNALEDSGFNFDDFSNSLSACHAALKRMLVDGEVIIGKPKNDKQTYKKVIKLTPPPRAGYLGRINLKDSMFAPTPNEKGKLSDLK
jgi:hypothetical protein